MTQEKKFTEGKIYRPLLQFMLPLLAANFLQALYNAGDMFIIGLFSTTSDISGVATGGMVVDTVRTWIASFAVGITVRLGFRIGENNDKDAGKTVGAGFSFFAAMGLLLAVLFFFPARLWARLMQSPPESIDKVTLYIRISALGGIFVALYYVLGSVFRATGDSKTPLVIVFCTFILNFIADFILVGHLKLGAGGSALTNVAAQALSVLIVVVIIRKNHLPFRFTRDMIRFDRTEIREIIRIGIPLAMQDLLVSLSFMVLNAVINSAGLIASAGMGIGEKVCAFIMLIQSSFSQALSAFVAQNMGARKPERARKALRYAILTSVCTGFVIGFFIFFRGDLPVSIFVKDKPYVSLAAWDYLKAYAFDCVLTAFMFCFHGYFVGCGATKYVMWDGILSAFLIRIPVAWLMSRIVPVSLFRIGLATPCATFCQIIGCLIYSRRLARKQQQELQTAS